MLLSTTELENISRCNITSIDNVSHDYKHVHNTYMATQIYIMYNINIYKHT